MPKDDDYLRVNNSALYHALQRMIVSPEKWAREKAWLQNDLSKVTKAATARARIGPEPGLEHKLSDVALEEWKRRLEEYVLSMDDLTADVFDLIASKWASQCSSGEQTIVVRASELLAWRGLNPTVSGFTTMQKEAIAQRVALLSSTWIEFVGPAERKRNAKPQKLKSRALVVTSIAEEAEDGVYTPYQWRVRPGDLFVPWLFGAPQFAFLSQAVLRYDWAKFPWEKRIARFSTWLFRIQKQPSLTLSVARLLSAIHMEESHRYPARTRRRLEAALNRLRSDGVLEGWKYQEGAPTGLEGWKSASLVLWHQEGEPDQEAREAVGAALRGKRLLRSLTQTEAARELGISGNWLAMIERGDRQPAPQLLEKIRAWLSDNYNSEPMAEEPSK